MRTFTATIDGETHTWRDASAPLWALALIVPLLTFLGWGAATLTGLEVFYWIGPFFVLVLVPALDRLFGDDPSNPPEWATTQLERVRYYRWLTYLYLPIQYAGLVLGAWLVVNGGLSWFGAAGLTATVGVVGGIAIANAHELGHKRDRGERWLARVVLAQSWYGHFYVEHNAGHHVRVATPEDPASARLGESFWAFLPRTVLGSVRSAWRLDSRTVLVNWSMSLVLFAILTAAFGIGVVPFLVAQAVVGFTLLELVNYVEHYGLLRQRGADGRYERCTPRHSWNSNRVVSNLFLYQLERHSDHHAHPTRRYQALRHFEDAPQLPSGYGFMITLSLVPPIWRRVMDRRVIEHYDGDVHKANMQPSQRDRLLARYG